MKVLGIDVGFGDCKITYGETNGTIEKFYKFNSVLGKVDVNELVPDKRVYSYHGGDYYIGKLALSLESSKIVDLISYENLEMYTPLLIRHVIENLPEVPAVIVVGLSIAHTANSAYFKEAIKTYLIKELNLKIQDVFVLPQGIGGKLTFDKYGLTFPEATESFVANSNYIGIDIGFNTLDIFQVVNNRTSSNLVRGLENEGIVVIVKQLQNYLKQRTNKDFTIKETKAFFDNQSFSIRGASFALTDPINQFKAEYIVRVKQLIENEFGEVLDKTDEMRIFGGGAYVLSNMRDSFVKFPSSEAEYYNSIGQYLFGMTKYKEDKNS